MRDGRGVKTWAYDIERVTLKNNMVPTRENKSSNKKEANLCFTPKEDHQEHQHQSKYGGEGRVVYRVSEIAGLLVKNNSLFILRTSEREVFVVVGVMFFFIKIVKIENKMTVEATEFMCFKPSTRGPTFLIKSFIEFYFYCYKFMCYNKAKFANAFFILQFFSQTCPY